MPTDLKPPLSEYFAASNAHDADSVAALFTDDARVHDERQDHRGRDAIRGWAADTFDKYQMMQSPGDPRQDGDSTIVPTEVSGNFPGSPIQLDFRFVLDGALIRELQIG